MEGDTFEDDNDDWQPPTEAEMKVIQARRERSDKISKIMGQYLLKGHKMLDTLCPVCCCILLQMNPSNKLHCVSCIDLDSETKKDDPALNSAAATSTVTEERHRATTSATTPQQLTTSSNNFSISTPAIQSAQQPQSSTCPLPFANGTTNVATQSQNTVQPSTSSRVFKREVLDVEEHDTPSNTRSDSENLSRSQLTAVHDIPASPAGVASNVHQRANPVFAVVNPSQSEESRATVMTSQNRHQSSPSMRPAARIPPPIDSNVPFTDLGRVTLQETITSLSMQLQSANRRLEMFDLSSFGYSVPSSYLELIDAIFKLSKSLSAAADAYKRLDEI